MAGLGTGLGPGVRPPPGFAWVWPTSEGLCQPSSDDEAHLSGTLRGGVGWGWAVGAAVLSPPP